MIKHLNKLLKLIGFNLVRAKGSRRKAPKSEAQRVKEFIEEFDGTPSPRYTAEELMNCPPNPAWKTQNDGKTHYIGDNCPGGHLDEFPGYEAKKCVVNPDAAFEPVDIGTGSHAMTTSEQKETPFEQLSVADKLNVLHSERHCEVANGAPAPTFETPRKGATEANQ